MLYGEIFDYVQAQGCHPNTLSVERSEEEPTEHQDPDLFVVTLRWEILTTVSDYREGRVPGEPVAG